MLDESGYKSANKLQIPGADNGYTVLSGAAPEILENPIRIGHLFVYPIIGDSDSDERQAIN